MWIFYRSCKFPINVQKCVRTLHSSNEVLLTSTRLANILNINHSYQWGGEMESHIHSWDFEGQLGMFITLLNVLSLFQPFLLEVIFTEIGTRIHNDTLTGWVLQHCLSPSQTGNNLKCSLTGKWLNYIVRLYCGKQQLEEWK